MSERRKRQSVAFSRPFRLAGIDDELPPGTYDVETVEVPLDGLSILAYRRVSTTIELPATNRLSRTRQLETIDPADLALALERDAEASNGKPQV